MTDLHPRPSLEVGDVLRAHGAAYRAKHAVTPEQAQVMQRLAACRTAALGGMSMPALAAALHASPTTRYSLLDPGPALTLGNLGRIAP
jgi:hypothetical protein